MKNDRLLDDIKSRLDIVDIISDFVELKKSGQNLKGLCPFHSEKTPSFMVHPDKQIFHCFGCGAGGDVITFIMKHEGFSFPEALGMLAKKAGINLREQALSNSEADLRRKLMDMQAIALKAFAEGLKASKKASAYLRDRGIREEMIQRFSLGYAPEDWHCLSNYLRKKGFPESLVLKSGIVSRGDKGIYDTFRGRIIFPINDLHGNIIAFGGRATDDSQPKYLNSPETPVFKKGETLFGLNFAKDEIRKNGSAIIVEGYFDVISCHQHGFCNAVAPLGTALTSGHLERLRRFTKRIIVVFDNDGAGRAAARRSLALVLEQGFSAGMLLLPEGDDPDSFLKRAGSNSFNMMLEAAKTPIEFALSISKKGPAEAVHELLETISAAKDPIMREELLGELSKRTGIGETIIRERLRNLRKKTNDRTGGGRFILQGKGLTYDEETLILSALIAFPERIGDVLQTLPVEEFKNMLVKGMLEKLRLAKSGFDAFQSSLSEEEDRLCRHLTFNPGFDIEHPERNLQDCIRKILIRRFDRQMKEAEVSGNLTLFNSLLMDRQKLLRAEEAK